MSVAYLSKDDYLERLDESLLVQLTDRQGTGEVDDKVLGQATEYATTQFNGRVLGRYVVPAEVPGWMKTLLLDMAIYHLFKDRSEFDEGVWKVRKVAHDDAIKFLTAVNSGDAILDLPLLTPVGGDVQSFTETGTVSVSARPIWG